MKHGSLFSGIGGFDLAAQWMGWENVFHCEMNPFGRKVLNHYWPQAASYEDITTTDFNFYRGRIDILSGGFPCQPYSTAGKRLGKEDDRHLWPEMLRAIREIKPTYVVGENVFGLINWNGGMVFDEVQADLEAQGYSVQPFVLPACAVGAPHRRDRIWFVARYSDSDSRTQIGGISKESNSIPKGDNSVGRVDDKIRIAANADNTRAINTMRDRGGRETEGSEREGKPQPESGAIGRDGNAPNSDIAGRGKGNQENERRSPEQPHSSGVLNAANANSDRLEGRRQEDGGKTAEGQAVELHARGGNEGNDPNTNIKRPQGGAGKGYAEGGKWEDSAEKQRFRRDFRESRHTWQDFPSQPPVCGGDDGLPKQLDGITFPKWRNESIKAYGNAIVPQVAHQIFKAIAQ